jgi:hypothetical protein
MILRGMETWNGEVNQRISLPAVSLSGRRVHKMWLVDWMFDLMAALGGQPF